MQLLTACCVWQRRDDDLQSRRGGNWEENKGLSSVLMQDKGDSGQRKAALHHMDAPQDQTGDQIATVTWGTAGEGHRGATMTSPATVMAMTQVFPPTIPQLVMDLCKPLVNCSHLNAHG